MKKFLGLFLILGFGQSFVETVPLKLKITVEGIKGGGVMWAKTFKWTPPASESWQEFSLGLWGQLESGLVDPEIMAEKAFSEVEKPYTQKASDYFYEFCHQCYPEIFYAKEKILGDVLLQRSLSYAFEEGQEWHAVTSRRAGVVSEDGLSTGGWVVGFTSY
ncbi:MAG: hypothetical protein BGO07_01775 [Alphaproteobacteria bacterium 40-19]|nr:MAG: hypothetical protein BGO07_01775 [Alphaproteobacteria bacterium 40-19]